eukprot:GEMP01044576.1.p1 GENE.GEMP01044576.1~~GEMP01044576.1.p1  ORF type:complete len:194 (+),score=40.97 GEMP01044576.1:120-701(+)
MLEAAHPHPVEAALRQCLASGPEARARVPVTTPSPSEAAQLPKAEMTQMQSIRPIRLKAVAVTHLSAMSSRFTSRRSSRIDQDQDNQEDGKRRVKFAEQHATIVNEEQVPMTRAMAKRVKQMQPKADTIYVYEQVVVSDRELDAAFGPGETAHERMLALEAQRRTGGGRFLDAANTDMPARKTDATSAINKIK